jgi:PAS domain S-box-containing protein
MTQAPRLRRRLPRKPKPPALRPRDARFRFLVENSRDIFFSMRLPEGRYEYISSGVMELHGMSPQQFYDDPQVFWRCVAPTWHERMHGWIAEVLCGKVRDKYEFEIIDRFGRLRWIEQRLVLVAAPDGRGFVLQGVASDRTEEREAALALRERAEHYRLLAESWPEQVLHTLNLDTGRVEYVSPSVERVLGYLPDELIGSPDMGMAIVAPQWREQVAAWFKELRAGIVRPSYEYELLRRDGSPRWVYQVGSLLPRDPGGDLRAQFTFRDITDARHDRRKLELSEALFRQLAEGWSEQVIMRYDLCNRRLEYLSPSIARVFGITPEMIARKEGELHDIIAPEWREQVAGWKQEAAQGRLAPEYEFELIDGWGRRRWVLMRGVILRGGDGRPQAAQFVLFDNTERKRLELELQSSRAFLECIIEQSPVSLWISDAEGTLIRTNQALRDTLQIEDADVAGRYNIFADRQAEEQGVMPIIRRVFEQGGTARFPLEYDTGRVDGLDARRPCRRILDFTITAVRDPADRTTNLIIQHVDITEQKRAQEELAKKDAMLSAMLRNLPFDFWARDKHLVSIMQSDASIRLWGDLGAGAEERVPPDTRAIWRETDRKVLEHSPVAEERSLRLPSGELRTYQSIVSQIRDGDEVLGLLGVNVDITERKAAEEALRRSTERYDELVRRIPVGVYLFSIRGGVQRFEYVSPRLCEMFGLNEAAFSEGARPFRPLAHPEDYDGMISAAETALARGAAFHWEGRFFVRGQMRWIRIEAEPGPLPDGVIWSGVVSDVTERRQAEEALSRSERRFAELIRNSFDTINILDADGRQVFVSDAVERMLGFTAAELSGIPVIEAMIHPDDQERVRECLARGLREGSAWAQYRHRHKDGSWVHLEAWGTNQLDNPDIGGVVVNVRDITDRLQAEEALARQSRLWRKLLESMHEGVWAFDEERRTIFANERLAAMTGYSVGELGRMRLSDMIDARQAQVLRERLQERRLGISGSMDYVLRRKDGALLPTHVSSAPILNADGEYEGLVCSLVDLSERKRMEGQLRRNQSRFEALYELSRLTTATEEQLAAYILRQALRLTGSNMGVVFFVSAGRSRLEPMAWEGKGQDAMCGLPVAGPTPWTSVYATGRPLMLNDFSAYAGQLPPGHAPVERFLGVPALDAGLPAAILGISGKEEPYTDEDSMQAALLMDGMWRAVRARRDQARIRASLKEKEALLREVHHRVKNNLQVVSSLLDMAGRRLPEPARRGLEEVGAKVQAMGLIHAQLHGDGASGAGAGIDLERYVRALFGQLREVYSGDMELSLDVRLDSLLLGLDAATPLGLVLNEALANAFRHARPPACETGGEGGRAGRVRIEAWREADGNVVIEVRDDGPGLPPGLDLERPAGLGMKLMAGLVRQQLRGELAIERGGGEGGGALVRIRFRPHIAG